MGVQIQDGVASDLMGVDATSKAGRVTLYNPDGSVLALVDRLSGGITPGTTRGLPIIGADYKTPRLSRAASDGALIAGGERVLVFHDACEGAAVNTNKWIQTLATMTITQAAATGILLNAGSSVTTTQGAMQLSHNFFDRPSRSTLLTRMRVRSTAHFNNNLLEVGFGSPASSTAASIGDGACWRKDGTGQYLPIVSINGSETVGTVVSFTPAATDYYIFEVQVEDSRVTFRIYTSLGALTNEQTIDFTVTTPSFAVTRLQGMMRTYNSGTVATAVQHFVDEIDIFSQDLSWSRPWAEVKVSQGDGILASPFTTFGQLALYTNNAATGTATPTNTTIGTAGLMGTANWSNGANSFAASESLDLIIFSYQNASPRGLMVKGINLDSVNLGAANGAAAYTIQWFLALNHSAVSLATAGAYPTMRKMLGIQAVAASAPIGTPFNGIDRRYMSGIKVFPGRFIAIGARVIGASAATASQVIRTLVDFDGYFE